MSAGAFQLDPAFETSSHHLLASTLCEVRLQDDARFPWLILSPRISGAVEIEDLTRADRIRLLDEIVVAGATVRAMGAGLGRPVQKLNVGALGNITRQLHVHVVGRWRDDPAWPGPVWGFGGAQSYGAEHLVALRAVVIEAFASGEV